MTGELWAERFLERDRTYPDVPPDYEQVDRMRVTFIDYLKLMVEE